MDIYRLPPPLQQRVMNELRPGEVVNWVGQPDPRRMMLGGFLFWIFFVPWTAFSLFWMAGAAGFVLPDFSNPSAFFMLFGIPFVLIGIGGLCAPVWAYAGARHTVYAISNKRAFMLSGKRSVTSESWQPEQLRNIVRTERPDGSGSLVFATETWRDSDGDRRIRRKGFLHVAEVRMVEAYLQRLHTAR